MSIMVLGSKLLEIPYIDVEWTVYYAFASKTDERLALSICHHGDKKWPTPWSQTLIYKRTLDCPEAKIR